MSAPRGTGRAGVGPVMAALAGYMSGAAGRALPAEVAEKTRHHVLDTLAAMVSGARLKPGRLAIDYVRGQGGAPEAPVPGSDVMTTAVNAALAGGIAAHADETDDSHPRSFSHPGCAVVPAALAMAFREGAAGGTLLSAVAFGYDLGTRSTMALGPDRTYRDHHRSTHSIAALFGAAGAAGVLAGLTEPQCRWLLSYAAQQASGLASWTRDEEHVEKAFDFGGMGARNGVAAATMVAAGFTGVEDVFSGPDNFFAAFGGDAAEMARDLGERFEVMDAHIKKWSIGSPVQAPLAALEALMAEHGIGPAEAARIEARIGPQEAHIVDDRAMPDICLQYLFAVMLLDGALTFAASHDYARMDAPDVAELRRRIALVTDPSLPRREGAVTVTTRAGETFERHVRHVRGTSANPMDRDEVAAKARDLMNPVLGEERAAALVESVWNLDALADVRKLGPLLSA